jgi:hypothetical protein
LQLLLSILYQVATNFIISISIAVIELSTTVLVHLLATSRISAAASDPTALQSVVLSLISSTGTAAQVQQVQTQMIGAISSLVTTSNVATGSTAELNQNIAFIQLVQELVTTGQPPATLAAQAAVATLAVDIGARMKASLAASVNDTQGQAAQQSAAHDTSEATLLIFGKLLSQPHHGTRLLLTPSSSSVVQTFISNLGLIIYINDVFSGCSS